MERLFPRPKAPFDGTEQDVEDAIRSIGAGRPLAEHEPADANAAQYGVVVQQARRRAQLTRWELAQSLSLNPVWLAGIEAGAIPASGMAADDQAALLEIQEKLGF